MEIGKQFNPFNMFIGLFIPNSIAMSNIPDASKLLLGRLMQFAGANGKAFPTRRTLALELNWSLPKLDRNIRNLKDLQLIKTHVTDEHSPSTYTFLYNEMYEAPLITDDSGVVIRNDSGAVITDDKYKRINNQVESRNNNIISKEIRRTPSHASSNNDPLEYNGLMCSICKEPQFTCKSGESCKNGHGGVEGIEKEKVMPKKLKKIKIVSKPKNIANPYNYCPDALKIVTHWQELGGKSHKNGNAKQGPKKIQSMIDELLILGRNPYIRVVDDSEIKTRQWTVNEIIDSINVYAKIKHKPIDKMYLNEFILFSYNGKNTRKLSDYSPLVESFEDIPNETTSKWKDKIKKKLKDLYPKEYIYDKVLLDCAAFLELNHKIYKVTPNGASYSYHILNVFIAYVRRIVTEKGSTDTLKYISGGIFLKDFITYSTRKSFLLIKRKKHLA